MKSIKLFIALVLFSSLLASSCSITMPIAASSNPVGQKRGQSTGTCYLGVLCFDVDASIQTAAKNAGITKISTVDLKTTNVLNIIITYTTVVTGE
ncbi:MAG: TRL-like family protein [Aquirufa sp.]|jgi:hypothetical protein